MKLYGEGKSSGDGWGRGGYRGRKVVTVHPQHAATKNTDGDYISNEETQLLQR